MDKEVNVSWVKPDPSFLRKFKKDMPTCEEGSGESDREDEMPQVVVLKKSGLSAEVMKIKKDMKESEKDEEPPADGKILFKKPVKRSSDKFEGIRASSSKKSENKEMKKEIKSGVEVKNTSLLSFGDGEDEDE